MTTTYRVVADGVTVFETTTPGDYDREMFPAEYRARPERGEVQLFVNGELVGVQRPIEEWHRQEIEAARARDLEAAGGVV